MVGPQELRRPAAAVAAAESYAAAAALGSGRAGGSGPRRSAQCAAYENGKAVYVSVVTKRRKDEKDSESPDSILKTDTNFNQLMTLNRLVPTQISIN